MSKGLRALKRIKDFMELNAKHWKQDVGYIEKELKEYEIEHTLRVRLENINYELVREKQENEKKLKALEIIKKSWRLSFYDEEQLIFIDNCYSITFYNKKEYDLLKEVLL